MGLTQSLEALPYRWPGTPLPHGERIRELNCVPRTAVGGRVQKYTPATPTPSPAPCPGILAPTDLEEWEVKASVKILSQSMAHGGTA